jgi:hypothetical protein
LCVPFTLETLTPPHGTPPPPAGADYPKFHLHEVVDYPASDGSGHRLALAYATGQIRVCDAASGDVLHTINSGFQGSRANLAAFTSTEPHGRVRFVLGMGRGAVWDEEGALVTSLPRHDDRGVLHLATYQEPGGRQRVVTADGQRVRICDGETGRLIHTLPGTLPVVTSLTTFRSETGDFRVVAGAYECMMLVWDPEAGMWRYTSEVAAGRGRVGHAFEYKTVSGARKQDVLQMWPRLGLLKHSSDVLTGRQSLRLSSR